MPTHPWLRRVVVLCIPALPREHDVFAREHQAAKPQPTAKPKEAAKGKAETTAAAPQPGAAEEPGTDTGDDPPGVKVNVSLTDGIIARRLPFDVPFYLTGTATMGSTRMAAVEARVYQISAKRS